ncbi:MAG: ABC-F family ATP-binding cassette domain-containing protein [Devosia sp.]|uniref:ABC-F family ATP-binding cassette domain-containing protein n=1 Tax=Devosia sp. TaxID=1871048 RepID=UPI001ACC3F1A|nr:ABC-F family ATP-binding cassette domain-containing protein [Devosia sp.]MBN9314385.1 ABC-F family ATP-binding cassette domain-containing protein [Devosia sp.]
MGSISLKNLSTIATAQLFSDLNLVIADGDRVGLVAGNGLGKTTLLRIIAGLAEPTSGEVTRSRGLRIGYVEQDVPAALLPLTMRDAVLEALPPSDRETDAWRADVALDGFETPYELRDRKVAELSGGWQRLMLIARVWVTDPDALLLDEPTNHLDLSKLFRLEEWFRREARNIPVIVASHDRDFLDAVTNRTLFLRPGTSRYFPLAYSAARTEIEREDASQDAQNERDLKEAAKLRKQAAKLNNIGINSGSDLLVVKTRQLRERAAKIEEAVRPAHKERSGEIRLANRGTHARLLVGIENMTVATPSGQALFRIDKLHVFQGDRIVLLGRNGVGKSQFVRLVHEAMTDPDGVAGIRVTPSLVLGYTDQDMSQLPTGETPESFISTRFKQPDARVRSLLAAAGFPIEKQGKPIGQLSFGQRARLGLLALRLTEPNFYLMDEPTNHVDIPGREALEREILEHEATAILVSHDRSFVRNVGNRYLQIDGRRLREVEGAEDFFEQMMLEVDQLT